MRAIKARHLIKLDQLGSFSFQILPRGLTYVCSPGRAGKSGFPISQGEMVPSTRLWGLGNKGNSSAESCSVEAKMALGRSFYSVAHRQEPSGDVKGRNLAWENPEKYQIG